MEEHQQAPEVHHEELYANLRNMPQSSKVMLLLSIDEGGENGPTTVDDTVKLSIDHVHPIEVREELKSKGFSSLEISYNADSICNRQEEQGGWTIRSKEDKFKTEKIKLLTNVTGRSICRITSNLIASHIYTAASVCLAIRKNLVIWIDCPYLQLKNHPSAVYWTSSKLWFDGSVKRRSYSGLLLNNRHFGLSPAMQEMEVTNMDEFAKYGIELKIAHKNGELNSDHQRPYLEMNFQKIIKNPYKNNLEKLISEEYVAPTELSDKLLGYIYGLQDQDRFPDTFQESQVAEGLEAIYNDPNYKPIHYAHPAIDAETDD